MTPDELIAHISSRYCLDTAKWSVRTEVTGSRFRLDLAMGRRDTSGMSRWEIERDDDRRYDNRVDEFAASVAFAMWLTSNPEFPAEFFNEMSRYAPDERDFLLDVATEARHRYAEWVAAGRVTDESVIHRVVARLEDVIRDDE